MRPSPGSACRGSLFFLAMALGPMVGVGALSLIARAIGARRPEEADGVYRQTLLLSLALSMIVLAGGYLLAGPAMAALAADDATHQQATLYLYGFIPALALMFPTGAMAAALRAAGVVRQPMFVQTAAVLINIILAPVLIAGWGTGVPLGVFGAGLASSLAGLAGLIAFALMFDRVQTLIRQPFRLDRLDLGLSRRIIGIGLPSAGEFALMFLTGLVVYGVIARFGPDAQAGYGVGSRVMQAIFLPAMAIAFAVAPVAGQNFGAGQAARVRETVTKAALFSSILMLSLLAFCQISPHALVAPFSNDPAVIDVAAHFLRIISLNFLPSALIFTASGTFQALGDTRPALIGSASRLITFAGPAIWLSGQPWARLDHVWMLSAASVVLHAAIVLWLLRGQLRKKLSGLAAPVSVASASA
ncbi:MATE family efflux transporter [Brevundimonas aveniformis]|uniref:MATE family efflux transporter n=1 Tax=Brevundimonas aveniformis TaxID=370977 RepID=UPI0024810A4F|nr:MATE family efflux transporter [Brevundimonas aveniformis]